MANDNVNHPNHYMLGGGLEAIDVIKASICDIKDPVQAMLTGQVLKYMLRWEKKNGLEDLNKARWYLNDLITEVIKDESRE